ncbi:hypothetical protein GCM10010435_57530 [Winogradskya consettensis]|uniref:Uncharacterized protein n=1 Tax=Winogradskya consettensis TaxID=113560 RepID=A0A919S8L0_9ACTN|nr:hypothetical protein [Actinoplanes consettensis]GIM67107.1 hypothetical protein Aco04nite_04790 [Actinoplanes consettensis]
MELKSVLRRARLSLVASLFLGALLGGPAHSPAVAAAAQPASPLTASASAAASLTSSPLASLASSPLVASDGGASTDHAQAGGPASVTGLSLITGLSSAAGLSSVNGLASTGFRSVTGHVPAFTPPAVPSSMGSATGPDPSTGSGAAGSGAAGSGAARSGSAAFAVRAVAFAGASVTARGGASFSTGPRTTWLGVAAIFAFFVPVLLGVPAAHSRAAHLIGLVSGVVAGPRAPPAAA